MKDSDSNPAGPGMLRILLEKRIISGKVVKIFFMDDERKFMRTFFGRKFLVTFSSQGTTFLGGLEKKIFGDFFLEKRIFF